MSYLKLCNYEKKLKCEHYILINRKKILDFKKKPHGVFHKNVSFSPQFLKLDFVKL